MAVRLRGIRISILLGACFAAASCGPGAGTDQSTDQGAAVAGRLGGSLADTLFAADQEFFRATDELGVGGWIDAFSPEGRLIVNGDEIVGRDAIRAVMEPYLEAFRLEWEPTRAAARAGNALGYTVGRYRTSPRGNPDSVVTTGTYVTIWERQADGSWKVAMDIGSPDPEPRP